MKNLILLFVLLGLTFKSTAFNLEGPIYVCPGTEFAAYTLDTSLPGDWLEWWITDGEIWDNVSQQWLTHYGPYQTNSYDNMTGRSYPGMGSTYTIRWDPNATVGSSGSIRVDADYYLLSYTDTDEIHFHNPPGTAAILSGEDFLENCNSQTNNYILGNIASGWSLDDGTWETTYYLVKTNETSTTVTIGSNSTTYSGPQTLTADMVYTQQGEECGTQNINKSIWLGKPTHTAISIVEYSSQQSVQYLCQMDDNFLEAKYLHSSHYVEDWTWQVSAGWSISNPDAPDNTIARVTTDLNNGTVYVKAYNDCGWTSNWHNNSYDVMSCFRMMTFPNPTTTDLTISFETSSNEAKTVTNKSMKEKEKEILFNIILFDDNQYIVFQEFNVLSPYTLDTSTYPKGTYFLHVDVGDEIIARRIMVE